MPAVRLEELTGGIDRQAAVPRQVRGDVDRAGECHAAGQRHRLPAGGPRERRTAAAPQPEQPDHAQRGRDRNVLHRQPGQRHNREAEYDLIATPQRARQRRHGGRCRQRGRYLRVDLLPVHRHGGRDREHRDDRSRHRERHTEPADRGPQGQPGQGTGEHGERRLARDPAAERHRQCQEPRQQRVVRAHPRPVRVLARLGRQVGLVERTVALRGQLVGDVQARVLAERDRGQQVVRLVTTDHGAVGR